MPFPEALPPPAVVVPESPAGEAAASVQEVISIQEQRGIERVGWAEIRIPPFSGVDPDLFGSRLVYVLSQEEEIVPVMARDLSRPDLAPEQIWRPFVRPHHPSSFSRLLPDEVGGRREAFLVAAAIGPQGGLHNDERVAVVIPDVLNRLWSFQVTAIVGENQYAAASIPGAFTILPEPDGESFRLISTYQDPTDRGDPDNARRPRRSFVWASEPLRLSGLGGAAVGLDEGGVDAVEYFVQARPAEPAGGSSDEGEGCYVGRSGSLWCSDFRDWETIYHRVVASRDPVSQEAVLAYIKYPASEDASQVPGEIYLHESTAEGWSEAVRLPVEGIKAFSHLALAGGLDVDGQNSLFLLAVWEDDQTSLRLIQWGNGPDGVENLTEKIIEAGSFVDKVVILPEFDGWDLSVGTAWGVVEGKISFGGEEERWGIYQYRGRYPMYINVSGFAAEPVRREFATAAPNGLIYSGYLRGGYEVYLPMVGR